MCSNIALRLEVSGIYQKNTKVLNSLKGKQVHILLRYNTPSELYLTTNKNTRNHI